MMIWCFLFRPFLSMERANWYSFKRLRIYVIISTALSLILLGAWLAMSWVVHARCPGNCFPGYRQNMQNCCICQGPEGVTTADEAGHLSNWYQLEIGFVFRKSVWWIRLDTLRPCFSLRGSLHPSQYITIVRRLWGIKCQGLPSSHHRGNCIRLIRRTGVMEIIRAQSRLMFQHSGLAHRFLRTAMTSSQPGCAETTAFWNGGNSVRRQRHRLNFLRRIGGFSTLGWFGSEREKSCVYLYQGAVVRVMQSMSIYWQAKAIQKLLHFLSPFGYFEHHSRLDAVLRHWTG